MKEYLNAEDIVSEVNELKEYDLEERTFQFADRIRKFVRRLPKDICNLEDIPQLVRASGSVGANYIEAKEALSKKDFYYRIKVCRKESKESRFFLRLIEVGVNKESDAERNWFMQEATEFIKIFSAILRHAAD